MNFFESIEFQGILPIHQVIEFQQPQGIDSSELHRVRKGIDWVRVRVLQFIAHIEAKFEFIKELKFSQKSER